MPQPTTRPPNWCNICRARTKRDEWHYHGLQVDHIQREAWDLWTHECWWSKAVRRGDYKESMESERAK